MNVHYMCAYYSQWAHETLAPRSQVQWDAFKFTRAVKSRRINGYLTVPWKNIPHERIDTSNIHRPRQIFGHFINNIIQYLGLETPSIVPIPSKDGLVGAENYRSLEMVRESLAGTPLFGNVEPILRFSTQLERAAEGGSRERSFLRQHMTLIGAPRLNPVVLVDDVTTSGGSLLASYDILSHHGFRPVAAICCAHTVSDSLTAAFGSHTKAIETEFPAL